MRIGISDHRMCVRSQRWVVVFVPLVGTGSVLANEMLAFVCSQYSHLCVSNKSSKNPPIPPLLVVVGTWPGVIRCPHVKDNRVILFSKHVARGHEVPTCKR